jgi:Flp pilus assembly protein TadG
MKRQRGAAVVEFALVLIILLLLVFGMIELGRALFKWNSAAEATRVGARTAAIVEVNDDAAVIAAMNTVMQGELDTSSVTVDYSIDGVNFGRNICVRGTCQFVRVRVAYEYRPVLIFFQPGISLLPETITMPSFATTYPVEALGAG